MDQTVIYFDQESLGKSSPSFSALQNAIPAGKVIQPSYPGCEVTAIDRIFSEQYDFHLSFHKDLPQFSFYPVPKLLIFAIDSHGGTFVSTAEQVAISEEAAAIYYLSRDRQLYYLSPNLRGLFSLLVFCPDWKASLGMSSIPSPEPSEKSRTYLIEAFQLSPIPVPSTTPQPEIQLFPSLAAAKKLLPFVEPSES